jgi:hypothetical protein
MIHTAAADNASTLHGSTNNFGSEIFSNLQILLEPLIALKWAENVYMINALWKRPLNF